MQERRERSEHIRGLPLAQSQRGTPLDLPLDPAPETEGVTVGETTPNTFSQDARKGLTTGAVTQRPIIMAKAIDWEAVEREYRAGQLSVSEIGRQHDVSHTAINKRAKRDGWARDLAARVRQEVSTRLVSDEVSAANAQEAVDAAAQRGVEVVRSHRRDIGRGRDVLARLIEELDMVTAHRGEIEEEIEAFTDPGEAATEKAMASAEKRRAAMHRAVSLSSRAGAMMSLSSAMKNVVVLERQAFSLDEDGGDESGVQVIINKPA